MQLTRNLYVPLVDTSKGSGTANWVPIDLSTQFELAYNPNTETRSYICYKSDYTVVTGYAPSMEQEIVLDSENPLYKFMDEYLNTFPTGSDAEIPFLLARPALTTGSPTVGLMWEKAVIVPNTLNTVDGKLSFTINLNGDPTKGTVSGIGTSKVTFATSTTQGAKKDSKPVQA